MQYYLHDGRDQYGPFTLEELRSQSLLKSDTLIWHAGITDWIKANQLDEVKEFLKAVPPPLSKPPAFAPIESKPIPTIKQPEQKSSSFSSWKTLAVIILVVVLGYAAYGVYDKQQRNDSRTQIRDNIRSYVRTGNSEYKISGLGGIYGLSIDVSNQSDYLLDNVRVMIRYIKANGETWKEEALDFALIPPNKKMTLRAPDSDRGTSIDYKIVSIRSTALGL
jgi:hypothetical protein